MQHFKTAIDISAESKWVYGHFLQCSRTISLMPCYSHHEITVHQKIGNSKSVVTPWGCKNAYYLLATKQLLLLIESTNLPALRIDFLLKDWTNSGGEQCDSRI